jgi:hypothetical protein
MVDKCTRFVILIKKQRYFRLFDLPALLASTSNHACIIAVNVGVHIQLATSSGITKLEEPPHYSWRPKMCGSLANSASQKSENSVVAEKVVT